MERGLHRQIPVIGSPQVSFPVAAAKTLLSCCLGPGGDSNRNLGCLRKQIVRPTLCGSLVQKKRGYALFQELGFVGLTQCHPPQR
jgi:hypothetical protein